MITSDVKVNEINIENTIKVINQLTNTSSTNDKLAILKANKENALLKRLLSLTYDKVRYNFFLTPKNLNNLSTTNPQSPTCDLIDVLNVYEFKLNTRKFTGHAARDLVTNKLQCLNNAQLNIALMVLNRDLRIGVNKKTINKVWDKLIIKPPYMRCTPLNKKTVKKIQFPAIAQLKADGMFCYAMVNNGVCKFESRSGEEYFFPVLEKEFEKLPDGVYSGELLVHGIEDRESSNGLIVSDLPPQDEIYMSVWSVVGFDEFYGKTDDDFFPADYAATLKVLNSLITLNESIDKSKINVIDTYEVNSLQELFDLTSKIMKQGLEGTILKDKRLTFKDGTSTLQLKLKLSIELEMRVTGFIEGKKGTDREHTFGSLTYSNDEGTIKGSVASGLTHSQLKMINSDRQSYIGKVITVKCNDISKSLQKEEYALSHPRFVEFRDDKDATDTLENAFLIRDSAFDLSNFVD